MLSDTIKLPDSFQDFVIEMTGGKGASPQLLTHCRRELMHRIRDAVPDDEFIEAWDKGFLVKCGDGITRRLYPRIFTYSADYPEKCVPTWIV